MLLHVSLLLCATPLFAVPAGYRHYSGYIPAGDDVTTLPAGSSLASAKVLCTATPACAAFTYYGNASTPTGTIYLKNSTGWDSFLFNATSEWSTYARVFGPCDLLLAAGTPCVAALSVARALYGAYAGPLYAVNRTSDGALLDVAPLGPGGAVDTAPLAAFCGGAPCVVQHLYDQSPMGNNLGVASKDGRVDKPVPAMNASFVIDGAAAFALFFTGGQGYRNDTTTSIATGNEEETMYAVIDGTVWNSECCFDFGNAEVDNHDDKAGTMEAVSFGSNDVYSKGAGEGPWISADLEDG